MIVNRYEPGRPPQAPPTQNRRRWRNAVKETHWRRAARIALLVMSLAIGGQSFASVGTQDVAGAALAYLDALYAFEFDTVGELLSAEAVFEDVTADLVAGAAMRLTGRAAIVAGFRAGAAGTRNSRYEVLHQFDSGNRLMLSLRYHTELDGSAFGAQGRWIPVTVHGLTVIEVSAGSVSRHTDFVDYEAMMKQVEEHLGPGALGRE